MSERQKELVLQKKTLLTELLNRGIDREEYEHSLNELTVSV